jgi:REP element-mobilizing transposase RayT
MSQPLSIEDRDWVFLITTRTAASRLWLINNKKLEYSILASLARYQHIHSAVIYAFILMGNHYHLLASFPKRNRALFMRDFNSAVARLVGRHVSAHGRRSVWARRYSYQVLLRNEDIFHWFYYVALNPVSSGIVKSIRRYPSYNSFSDAAAGRSNSYRWIDWSKYLMKRRHEPGAKPETFSKEYPLILSRLPGYESLSPEAYRYAMHKELNARENSLLQERRRKHSGFLGEKKLKGQASGSSPRTTKTSARYSFRPLVLTLCAKTKKRFLELYFSICKAFKEASAAFRSGDSTALFPAGTYPPPRLALASK